MPKMKSKIGSSNTKSKANAKKLVVDSADASIATAATATAVVERQPEATALPLVPVRPQVTIVDGLPWSDWNDLKASRIDVSTLKASHKDGVIFLEGADLDDLDERQKPRKVEIARLDSDGSRVIGELAGFPTDFVSKLPVELRSQVINARLDELPSKEYMLSADGGMLKSISPGWRDFPTYRETAQVAYDYLGEITEQTPEVAVAKVNGHMSLRLMTQRQDEITSYNGDFLTHGVEIIEHAGVWKEVNLYSDRWACRNGLRATEKVFSWQSRTLGSVASQLTWLRDSIKEALDSAPRVVEHARQMASTQFMGDSRAVLRQRATALRIPSRYMQDIYDAFDQEPGDTEWHLLNALTRFATHNERLVGRQRRDFQMAAGRYTHDYDIVTARVPRPIATRGGYEIVD